LLITSFAGVGCVSGSKIANSSPPRRATVSLERRLERKTCATVVSTWSPVLCPRVSLTFLKSFQDHRADIRMQFAVVFGDARLLQLNRCLLLHFAHVFVIRGLIPRFGGNLEIRKQSLLAGSYAASGWKKKLENLAEREGFFAHRINTGRFSHFSTSSSRAVLFSHQN
jgi:hypothetical protein